MNFSRDRLVYRLHRAFFAAHPETTRWRRLGFQFVCRVLLPFCAVVAVPLLTAGGTLAIFALLATEPGTAFLIGAPLFWGRSFVVAFVLRQSKLSRDNRTRFLPVSAVDAALPAVRTATYLHLPTAFEAALLARFVAADAAHALPGAFSATMLTLALGFILSRLPGSVLGWMFFGWFFGALYSWTIAAGPGPPPTGAVELSTLSHPASFALSLTGQPVWMLWLTAAAAVALTFASCWFAIRLFNQPVPEPSRREPRALPPRSFNAPLDALLYRLLSPAERRLARTSIVSSSVITRAFLLGTAALGGFVPLFELLRHERIPTLLLRLGAIPLVLYTALAAIAFLFPFPVITRTAYVALPYRLADHLGLAFKTIALRSALALGPLAAAAAWLAPQGWTASWVLGAALLVVTAAGCAMHLAIPLDSGARLTWPNRLVPLAREAILCLPPFVAFCLGLKTLNDVLSWTPALPGLAAVAATTLATLATRLGLNYTAYARGMIDVPPLLATPTGAGIDTDRTPRC